MNDNSFDLLLVQIYILFLGVRLLDMMGFYLIVLVMRSTYLLNDDDDDDEDDEEDGDEDDKFRLTEEMELFIN